MKKAEFEEALRLVGKVARDREVYVFGSQAIHGLLKKPPAACLISAELDIYPRNHPQAVPLVIGKLGRRSSFARKGQYYVDCVSPELSTLPAGWTERLVPFKTPHTGGVTGWCLEIHDLCLAKLAAGRPKDLRYIRALLRHKLARADIIASRLDDMPTTPAGRTAMRKHLKTLVGPKKRARSTGRLRP